MLPAFVDGRVLSGYSPAHVGCLAIPKVKSMLSGRVRMKRTQKQPYTTNNTNKQSIKFSGGDLSIANDPSIPQHELHNVEYGSLNRCPWNGSTHSISGSAGCYQRTRCYFPAKQRVDHLLYQGYHMGLKMSLKFIPHSGCFGGYLWVP